jgi:hypothetical protein
MKTVAGGGFAGRWYWDGHPKWMALFIAASLIIWHDGDRPQKRENRPQGDGFGRAESRVQYGSLS